MTSSKLTILVLLAVGAAGQSLPAAVSPGLGIVESQQEQYAPVVASIVQLLASSPGRIQNRVVRLAWHTMAVYRQGETPEGGSNGGCIRHAPQRDEAGNNGLDEAKLALDPVKAAHPWITYSDLYVLAGTVAVERAGGPTLFFQAGRRDFQRARVIERRCPAGRLPAKHINNDAWPHVETQAYLYEVFRGLGLHSHTTTQEDADGLHRLVAAMGGHTLGAMHNDLSGNAGPWTTTPARFNNEFFVILNDNAWDLSTQSLSRSANTNGRLAHDDLQYEAVRVAMLPADIALKHNALFADIVSKYAADEGLFFYHFAAAWKILSLNGWEQN